MERRSGASAPAPPSARSRSSTGARRTATVTAISELRTYGLPVFVFRPFVEARPQVAWKLLEAMADRLAAAERR